MNEMNQNQSSPRALSPDELESVSGGKKPIAVIVDKCTTTTNKDGSAVRTCTNVSVTTL